MLKARKHLVEDDPKLRGKVLTVGPFSAVPDRGSQSVSRGSFFRLRPSLSSKVEIPHLPIQGLWHACPSRTQANPFVTHVSRPSSSTRARGTRVNCLVAPDDMEIIWSESSVPAIHGRLFARNHRRMHKVLEVPKDLIPYYGLRLMPDGEIVVQEPASSPYRLEVRPRRFGQLWNKSQMLYRNSTRHGAGRVGV